jgi:hypothetical protein
MHSINPLDIKDSMDITAEERLMVIADFLEKTHRGVEDLGLCTLISIGYNYQIFTLQEAAFKMGQEWGKKLVHFSLFVAITKVVFPYAMLALRLR